MIKSRIVFVIAAILIPLAGVHADYAGWVELGTAAFSRNDEGGIAVVRVCDDQGRFSHLRLELRSGEVRLHEFIVEFSDDQRESFTLGNLLPSRVGDPGGEVALSRAGEASQNIDVVRSHFEEGQRASAFELKSDRDTADRIVKHAAPTEANEALVIRLSANGVVR